jgi:hypothetical protein
MIGQGGAAKTINGVDIWQIGTPPRKFQIIGFIEDSRPGGPPSMAQRDGALAAVAKAHGGDGVLIQSDCSVYTPNLAVNGLFWRRCLLKARRAPNTALKRSCAS